MVSVSPPHPLPIELERHSQRGGREEEGREVPRGCGARRAQRPRPRPAPLPRLLATTTLCWVRTACHVHWPAASRRLEPPPLRPDPGVCCSQMRDSATHQARLHESSRSLVGIQRVVRRPKPMRPMSWWANYPLFLFLSSRWTQKRVPK
jgi:hypothetical protein